MEMYQTTRGFREDEMYRSQYDLKVNVTMKLLYTVYAQFCALVMSSCVTLFMAISLRFVEDPYAAEEVWRCGYLISFVPNLILLVTSVRLCFLCGTGTA